jgi:hypothetical protein
VHQTVTEFLAARYLVTSRLAAAQVNGLLRGRGGQLAPQVQAVAAWLVAIAPHRFIDLLDDDPLAFVRSKVELTDNDYRKVLVERLLELAQDYSLTDIPFRQLGGLSYSGIEARLRLALTDPTSSFDTRYLAINLISDNNLTSLHGSLVALALDERAPVALRNAAGRRAMDLVRPTSLANPLAALADPANRVHDENDELLGVGLRALLRAGTSPAEILPLLKAPSTPDFFGSYRTFVVRDLPAAFNCVTSTTEIRTALLWLANASAGFSDAVDARSRRRQSPGSEELRTRNEIT